MFWWECQSNGGVLTNSAAEPGRVNCITGFCDGTTAVDISYKCNKKEVRNTVALKYHYICLVT